jgi:hypothetical protein
MARCVLKVEAEARLDARACMCAREDVRPRVGVEGRGAGSARVVGEVFHHMGPRRR